METKHPVPKRPTRRIHERILLPGGDRRNHFCSEKDVWFRDLVKKEAQPKCGGIMQTCTVELYALKQEEK